MSDIAANLLTINDAMYTAVKKTGRTMGDIKLIGVTKTVTPERIVQLLAAGVNCFGENRVQEFLPKHECLQHHMPTWHFIGHLQRNKVKFIIDKVAMIHSIDNMALALEVDKRASMAGIVMDILVEINIAGEDSKHGLDPSQALPFVQELTGLSNIRVKGLMCIAPFVKEPEDNRPYFKKMHKLLLDINQNNTHNHCLTELSMGMSGDYTVAIEEGATMVRIGTALVG
ncbi:MAG: YggS family pyridoxal phosphate-dependent enzyme [Defluviitaleaceae bacterium]|nr:YggS family pyridoxal phosphate-dependent enzyme [Defluviitaleaceae bacterium]